MNDAINIIENYQDLAMKTCLDNSRNKEYAYYGLLSEIHELCAKIDGMRAKKIRDCGGCEDNEGCESDEEVEVVFDEAKYLARIQDELGDCFWFVALWCELNGSSFDKLVLSTSASPLNHTNIAFWYIEKEDYHISAEGIWGVIAMLKRIIEDFNFSLKGILCRNICKLASRAKRGVLKGNGDER